MSELAIHEAGHAIMFDALGVPIEFVTITAGCFGENASLEGCVKLENDCTPDTLVIPGTLAGPGASFYIAGVPPNLDAVLAYRSDQITLRTIHKNQKDAGTYDVFWARLNQFLNSWLRTWLIQNRSVILRLARRLEETGTLRAVELRQALELAWDSSKPDIHAVRSDMLTALTQALNS